MLKTGIFLLFIVLLSCESKNQNQNPSPAISTPAPAPAPLKPWAWGEVGCQKSSSCRNPLLNVNQWTWANALEREFLTEEDLPLSPELIFDCGQRFFALAVGEVRISSQDISMSELTSFASKVLDLRKCQRKNELEKNMNNYLNEYLKENLYETI